MKNPPIYSDISLKSYNTFGIDVVARQFAIINTLAELTYLLSENRQPVFILGGGSNLLLTKNIQNLVLKNNIKGIEVVHETPKNIWVKAGAGENWHDLVLWCVARGFGGIENLSLIPGTVGAAPVQNIGAYGVELKDVFHSLEAISLEAKNSKNRTNIIVFKSENCNFGYRDSLFKKEGKNKYCIINVTLKLTKNPVLSLDYGDIQKTLQAKNIIHPNIKDISDAIIAIRSSKLPDPKVLGNAGSFFKNPEISIADFKTLQAKFQNIVGYPSIDGQTAKVPAAWLIEQCGWKGKRINNAGCHANHALVLVNYGVTSGKEIHDLALRIIQDVKTKFGIGLIPEVNIV